MEKNLKNYIYIYSCAQSFSHVRLFVTPWTIDHQAHLSMELSKQEYWTGLPFPTPGDLPNSGISNPQLLCLLHWQMDLLPLCHLSYVYMYIMCIYVYTYIYAIINQIYFSENRKKMKQSNHHIPFQ